MLPVVAGRAATTRQILVYSVLLVPVSMLPWALGFAGAIYGAVAAICGAILVALALQLRRSREADRRAAHRLFAFSIVYLVRAVCGAVGQQSAIDGRPRSPSRAAATVGSLQAAIRSATGPDRAQLHQSQAQTRSDMRYAVLARCPDRRRDARRLLRRRARSERTHRRRRTANPVQLARHHAGDRDPDDPRHARRRLVVPLVQQARPLPARTSTIPAGSRCSSGRSRP